MVVAALVDSGQNGSWGDSLLGEEPLAAPHLLPAEVANILRRAASTEEISNDTAALAHADLLALPIEFFPYEPFAERVWQLRDNLTTDYAWYVALAEALGARLATLDRPLSRGTGPRCDFETPPQPSGRP